VYAQALAEAAQVVSRGAIRAAKLDKGAETTGLNLIRL
jgi:hypothetical protein